VTRRVRFEAAGLVWWAVAGCAPALVANPPVETAASYSRGSEGAPTCEVTYPDSGSASIVCRSDDGPRVADAPAPTRPSLMPPPGARVAEHGFATARIEGPAADAPEPFVRRERDARAGETGPLAEDELAPDPFATATREPPPPAGRPLADDDLAPDPFARAGREPRSPAGPPLADDDLAPDPFARSRAEARPPARKPLAADGLAPGPF